MDFVLFEIRENIALITLNRPEKLNALNHQTLGELRDCLEKSLIDASIRGLILTGSGEKAFVAGADIKELSSLDPPSAKDLSKINQDKIFNRIALAEKPIMACINGFALGGGLELALACHFRYASENARFGLPELNLGIIPGYGGTQRLTELIGKARALEMILFSETINSEKALEWGLIHGISKQEDLLTLAFEKFQLIKSKSPLAIASALKSIHSFGLKAVDGYSVEIDEFAKLFESQDFKEGTQAFLEKRKPHFQGI
jgi:enoyl-CoA hydratase